MNLINKLDNNNLEESAKTVREPEVGVFEGRSYESGKEALITASVQKMRDLLNDGNLEKALEEFANISDENEKEKACIPLADALIKKGYKISSIPEKTKTYLIYQSKLPQEMLKNFALNSCRQGKYDTSFSFMYMANKAKQFDNMWHERDNMYIDVANEHYNNGKGDIEKTLDALRQVGDSARNARVQEFYKRIIDDGLVESSPRIYFNLSNFMYIYIKMEEFARMENKEATEEACHQFLKDNGKKYHFATICQALDYGFRDEPTPTLKEKIKSSVLER